MTTSMPSTPAWGNKQQCIQPERWNRLASFNSDPSVVHMTPDVGENFGSKIELANGDTV
jgi:hypothetical protein